MKRKGYTLIELMVGLILFAIVMAALLGLWSSLWKDNVKATNLSTAQFGAKEVVFKLAEAFRQASFCTSSDSGCTVGAAIQNASSSACTVYSRNSSNALVQTTYSIDGSGNFKVVSGSQTLILASGVSMTLTYYSSTTYNATSLTSFTPTSSTAYQLIAVQISVTVTQGTISDSYTTLVRLNNGPGTAP